MNFLKIPTSRQNGPNFLSPPSCNSILLLSGVELKLLCYQKIHTTLVKTVASNSQKPDIVTCSDDGTPTSGNLRNNSYCRLCGSVAYSYSDAFTHSSGVLCQLLLPENYIECPICNEGGIAAFWMFAAHFRSCHKAYLKLLPFEFVPEMLTVYDGKQTVKQKALSLLWMLKCVTRLYTKRHESEKLFLPHLSYATIAAGRPTTKFPTLCPWTVCICVFAHEHDYETDAAGACTKCKNYHQFTLKGVGPRNCVRRTFQGVLRTYVLYTL